jgi:hypothetical protein
MALGPPPDPGRDEEPARDARGPGDPLDEGTGGASGWRLVPSSPGWPP